MFSKPNDSERNYLVGRGRTPVHSRYKPGQSGHRSGRPKGSKNASTILRQILAEKVTLREGSRTRRVSRLEALLRATVQNGMKGDVKATAVILNAYDAICAKDEIPTTFVVRFSDLKKNDSPTDEGLRDDQTAAGSSDAGR